MRGCSGEKEKVSAIEEILAENFKVGWSMADITLDWPVLVSGQFHARVSEGVNDHVYATTMAFESGSGSTSEKVIMISCDLVSISDDMRGARDITRTYTFIRREESVKERYDLEKIQPKLPTELHVVRLGDIVIATNPFELYLDYGMRIKARSTAIQTFLVQLAGGGTYLPTERSVKGSAYGAVPASTLVGP